MSKVITFSRVFPSYHPKAGQPTHFVEKIWESMLQTEQISTSKCVELSRQTGIGNLDMYKIRKIDFTPKHHTIRAGHRFKVGDLFSPRVWGEDINLKTGRKGPYHSKQITIGPDIEVKKAWDFELTFDDLFYIDKDLYAYSSSHEPLERLASNDGLEMVDLLNWFDKPFEGQIICWNENVEY